MTKTSFSIICALLSLNSIGEPSSETILLQKRDQNGVVQKKEVQIRKLDIPEIYEIRDKEKVFGSIDLDLYKKDVFVGKLLPRHETQELPSIGGENPFINLDIQDIFVNEICINGTGINDIYCDFLGVATNKFNVRKIEVVVNESIYKYLDALKDETRFKEEYIRNSKVEYLRDLYNLSYFDRCEWIRLFKENANCNVKYVQNRKKFKILAEVRMENPNDNILYEKNLTKALELGYDGILFRFDTTEDMEQYKKTMNIAIEKGFDVFLTYVGLDNQKPRWNPFCNPYRLEYFLRELCPLAKGIFMNWRSTSSHVKLLPIEFFNYICNTSRKYNDRIWLFGEVFYGRIDYLHGERKIVCTCPSNATGILINNMGYYGYNHSHIVNNLFSKSIPNYGRLHKVGQVIGYFPYYCSKQDIGLDSEQEWKYKGLVEKSFNNCNASTITFLHDGVDDNYVIDSKYNTTDNILTDKKFTNNGEK